MAFLGRHQGYLSLRVGSPVLKQVASGNRAIGICNTEFRDQLSADTQFDKSLDFIPLSIRRI